MGIMSRMLRLCKADVHGVMDQLEDKGLLLKQALREMETGLKTKELHLGKITGRIRQAERDLAQRRDETRKLEKDLELAVSKGKDDIARMLIRKRRILEDSCGQLDDRITGLSEEQNVLSETLDRQRLQYDRMKIKAAAFYQRAESRGFEDVFTAAEATRGWKVPTEEEIELELLQRKEAHEKGGAV